MTTILHVPADGPPISGAGHATDLVGEAAGIDAELVAVPATRLDERFFTLSTGVAGEILQKLAQYRVRLAVVGDITAHLERSESLRALVRESNRGRDAWFVADRAELERRLGG